MSEEKKSVTRRILLVLSAPFVWIFWKGPMSLIKKSHEQHEHNKAHAKTWYGRQHIFVKALLFPLFLLVVWPIIGIWALFHGGLGSLKRNFYDFLRGTVLRDQHGRPIAIKFVRLSDSIYFSSLMIYCFIIAAFESLSGQNTVWATLGAFVLLGFTLLVVKTDIAWDKAVWISLAIGVFCFADYGVSEYFESRGILRPLGDWIVGHKSYASPGTFQLAGEILLIIILAELIVAIGFDRHTYDGTELTRHRLWKSDLKIPIYMRACSRDVPDIFEAFHGCADIRIQIGPNQVTRITNIFGLSLWLKNAFLSLMNVASFAEMQGMNMERDENVELTIQAGTVHQLSNQKGLHLEGESVAHSSADSIGEVEKVSMEGM